MCLGKEKQLSKKKKKNTGLITSISDTANVRARKIIEDRHYIMIQGSTFQEDLAIFSVEMPNKEHQNIEGGRKTNGTAM